jgi:hypothetical protein
LLAVGAGSSSAVAAPGSPTLAPFDSPAAALATLLAQKPRVIAFGEYHEIEGAPKVRSALRHFLDELWPLVAPVASDLIVETWITEGRCGKREKSVVSKVEQDTQRPASTEDEVVTLLERAKAGGVAPHILVLSCIEYVWMSDGKGGVDYLRLLQTITAKLREAIEAALAARRSARDRAVVVYGGALHNDLHPRRELREFSFAPEVSRRVRGRFLEVDLYVPEYVERVEEVTAEPWFAEWTRSPPGKTVLVRRGPGSYILVFPRSAAAAPVSPRLDEDAAAGRRGARTPPDAGAPPDARPD